MTHASTLVAERQRLEVRHLIVTGMRTENCVDTSCGGALSGDVAVTLVEGQQ